MGSLLGNRSAHGYNEQTKVYNKMTGHAECLWSWAETQGTQGRALTAVAASASWYRRPIMLLRWRSSPSLSADTYRGPGALQFLIIKGTSCSSSASPHSPLIACPCPSPDCGVSGQYGIATDPIAVIHHRSAVHACQKASQWQRNLHWHNDRHTCSLMRLDQDRKSM